MVAFLVLTATTFCLFGFILGVWAKSFEQLSFIPMLVITPLTFLGGAFYSIDMLPPAWRTFSLFNPVVYLISGYRWSFYDVADVNVGGELRRDALLLRGVRRRGRVDLPDGLPAQELTPSPWAWPIERSITPSSSASRRGPSSVQRASCVSDVRNLAITGFNASFTWVSS